jgi:hypothetical protein
VRCGRDTRLHLCTETARQRLVFYRPARPPSATISASSRASTGHPRCTHHQRELHRTARSVDRSCRKWRREISPTFIPRMPTSSRLPQPTDDKLFQGANRGTHIALAAHGAAAGTGGGLPSRPRATAFVAAEVSGVAAVPLGCASQSSLRWGCARRSSPRRAILGRKGIDPDSGRSGRSLPGDFVTEGCAGGHSGRDGRHHRPVTA